MHCLGHYIDSGATKINRVAKSTLAADTVAIADTLDGALWFETLPAELLHAAFSRRIISPLDAYPLLNPFAPEQEIKVESTLETTPWKRPRSPNGLHPLQTLIPKDNNMSLDVFTQISCKICEFRMLMGHKKVERVFIDSLDACV